MSRTRRGSKSPGYDYWSRRPFSNAPVGSFTKKRTNKAERKQAEQVIEGHMSEIDDPNDDPCMICGLHHAWEPDEDECEAYVIDLLNWGSL